MAAMSGATSRMITVQSASPAYLNSDPSASKAYVAAQQAPSPKNAAGQAGNAMAQAGKASMILSNNNLSGAPSAGMASRLLV